MGAGVASEGIFGCSLCSRKVLMSHSDLSFLQASCPPEKASQGERIIIITDLEIKVQMSYLLVQ